jgi:hypothetical protein
MRPARSPRIGHLLTAVVIAGMLSGRDAHSAVHASEIKIIANSSVKVSEVSMEDLQRIFLLKTASLPDGGYVRPVLSFGNPAYPLFLKECMGKTDAALNTYYRSFVFTGKALMPKALSSDAEVIAYVSRTKGAIGYVSASTNTGGLKSLTIR